MLPDPAGESTALEALRAKAEALTAEADRLHRRGDLADALPLARQALKIRRALYPKADHAAGHPDLALALNEVAAILDSSGRLVPANRLYRGALAMCRQLYPASAYPIGHQDLARALNNLAANLRQQSRNHEAAALYRESLAIYRAVYPADQFPTGHPALARGLNNLAFALADEGDVAEAGRHLEESLFMRRRLYPQTEFPDGHPSLVSSLNNLGRHRFAIGEYDDAEPLQVEALETARRLYPSSRYPAGHPDLARAMDVLGELRKAQWRLKEADDLCREALEMRRRLYPATAYPGGHAQVANSLDSLADLRGKLGAWDVSASLYTEALAIRRAEFPPNEHPQGHPVLSTALLDLAIALEKAGRYREAEPLLAEAVLMDRTLYPRERFPIGHASLATSIGKLAGCHNSTGRYDLAEPLFDEAIAMWRNLDALKERAQGSLELAAGLNDLAATCLARGEFARAGELYREAIRICRATPTTNQPRGLPLLPTCVAGLGILLERQGEYARAEAYYREALASRRVLYPTSVYPRGSTPLAGSIGNLAYLLQSLGRFDEAEPYYREALEMDRALFPVSEYPRGHDLLANSINNLAYLYICRADYGSAASLLLEAVAIRRGLYPQDLYPHGHESLSTVLSNLATFYKDTGDYARAEPLAREVLACDRALYPQVAYPDGHRNLATSINNLASLYLAEGRHDVAAPLYGEALEMYNRGFATFVEAFSEAESRNYAATLPNTRDGWLTATRGTTSDAEVYGVYWGTRSILSRALGRRRLTLLASRKAEAARVALKLGTARRELAAILISPSHFGDSGGTAAAVAERKEALERELALLLSLEPVPRGASAPPDLSAALPPGSAFIDLCCYKRISHETGIRGKGGERWTRCYLAFVLGSGRAAVRVELGEAALIERACEAWRERLAARRPAEAEAAVLADLVWRPLERAAGGVETLWIAPDGRLGQIPWAALPTGGDAVLLDDVTVSLVADGEYLLDRLRRPAVAWATVDDSVLIVGGVRSELAPFASPLGGAERELAGVVAAATQHMTQPPRCLVGSDARPDAVLSGLEAASYGHIAAHGFYARPAVRSALGLSEERFAVHPGGHRASDGSRNPLVLSGLVLSGGPWDGVDRGVLTAEAVAGLQLERMRLAVLSACESGLGEVIEGEGLLGLQRAFHLAGCGTVVASLWEVDDEAAADLVERFYHELWSERRPPSEALRFAQQEIRRRRPPQGGSTGARGLQPDAAQLPATPAGPDHAPTWRWAAFVSSGDGR